MFFLGDSYLHGNGVKLDRLRAVTLLSAAAANNYAKAMKLLGDQYMTGLPGVFDKNPGEAFRLYSSAYDLGNLEARGNLGVLYFNGQGVEKDEKLAGELFKTGAEQKDPLCMFNYAQLLETGIEGTRANAVDAKNWYIKAAQAGFPPAIEWCNKNKALPPSGSSN